MMSDFVGEWRGVVGSKMTPRNQVLEGKNWKLGEYGWVKID